MPKKYARIWLEVTDVRVERVQDISEEDAIAEGIKNVGETDWPKYEVKGNDKLTNYPQVALAELWDSLNAKRGFGWDINPFVWVNEFKRIER